MWRVVRSGHYMLREWGRKWYGHRENGRRGRPRLRLQDCIKRFQTGIKGKDLLRKHRATLNRLRTGVGRYRVVQIIYEEVGTGGQCGMWVWRARTDGWSHHQQLPTTSTTIRSWPLRSWTTDQSMATKYWIDNMIWWYTKEEEGRQSWNDWVIKSGCIRANVLLS